MENGVGHTPNYLTGAGEISQDWDRLRTHLAAHGLGLDRKPAPRQFAAGFGNLNYRLLIDGRDAVLRRPPLGPIPPGGNDMGRESRIITGLSKELPLVPKCLHFCDDTDVLGAQFFIMEFRPGIVIGGDLPPALEGWRSANGKRPGEHMGHVVMRTLADLHRVDPVAVGLDTLGRPEGFLERTQKGWSHRAELAWEGETPAALPELLTWLDAEPVPDADTVFMHNDFKLDNLILNETTLEPVAMIDWDMGTRGDPLYDLAVVLCYWTEAGDPQAVIDMNQMPTTGHGFPTREQAAAIYAELTGRDLSGFRYRRVLAMVRTACVFRQLYRRFTSGGTDDPRYEPFGHVANGILEFGVDVAHGRCF
ncbi:MAG: phosphotransferase family protein [Rhodospirillaceae bacterium]|nr:phosphotransferase family protein [Rhodospirillaceae bacterium]